MEGGKAVKAAPGEASVQIGLTPNALKGAWPRSLRWEPLVVGQQIIIPKNLEHRPNELYYIKKGAAWSAEERQTSSPSAAWELWG
jgi:hypothetical protein